MEQAQETVPAAAKEPVAEAKTGETLLLHSVLRRRRS